MVVQRVVGEVHLAEYVGDERVVGVNPDVLVDAIIHAAVVEDAEAGATGAEHSRQIVNVVQDLHLRN